MEFERFSSLKKLLRVSSYVMRFVHNIRAKVKKKVSSINGYLNSEELIFQKLDKTGLHVTQ